MPTLVQSTGDVGQRTTAASLSTPSRSGSGSVERSKSPESLTGDLLNIAKGMGSVKQESVRINKVAALRASQENLADMSIELQKNVSMMNNDNIREIQELNNATYQKYASVAFNDEDAQQLYDHAFKTQGLVAMEKLNANLSEEADKQSFIKLRDNHSANIQNMATVNIPLTSAAVDNIADSVSANKKYMSKNDAYDFVAKNQSVAFDTKQSNLETLLKDAGYDPKTGITDDVLRRVFNDIYQGFGKYKDGNTVWRTDIGAEATNTLNSSWRKFRKSLGVTGDQIDMNFKNAKSVLAKNYTSISTGKQDLETSFLPNTLSTKEGATYRNKLIQYEKEFNKLSMVTSQIDSNSQYISTLMSSLEDSPNMAVKDDITGETYTVTKEYVNNVLKTKINKLESEYVPNTDGSTDKLSKIFELKALYGVDSPMVTGLLDMTAGDSTGFHTIDQVRKFNEIVNFAQTNEGYAGAATVRNNALQSDVQNFIRDYDSIEDPDKKLKRFMSFNSKIQAKYNNLNGMLSSGSIKKKSLTAQEYISDMWFSSGVTDQESMDGIMRYAAQAGYLDLDQDKFNENIDDMTMSVYSPFKTVDNAMFAYFGWVDKPKIVQKMFKPDGSYFESEDLRNAYDQMIFEYNKKNGTDYDITDFDIRSNYTGAKGGNEVTHVFSLTREDGTISEEAFRLNGSEAEKAMIRYEQNRSVVDKVGDKIVEVGKRQLKVSTKYEFLKGIYEISLGRRNRKDNK